MLSFESSTSRLAAIIQIYKISRLKIRKPSQTYLLVSYADRGPQIRVLSGKLFFLFLNENICCGYSKEPSQ